MKTFKQFITEARTQITPDEEEQIVKHYTKRIKSGGNFGFPELSDETGYHHNTLRRNIFTRGKYNSIVRRIKEKDPEFEPVEMRFGAGRPKKDVPHFATPAVYNILKRQLSSGETSYRQIKKDYPSASMATIKHHLS